MIARVRPPAVNAGLTISFPLRQDGHLAAGQGVSGRGAPGGGDRPSPSDPLATGLRKPPIMVDDNSDREEVDLLIRGLAAKRRATPAAAPVVSLPLVPPVPAQSPFAQLVETPRVAPRPESKESTRPDAGQPTPTPPAPPAPPMPAAGRKKRFEIASFLSLLPALPDLRHVLPTPGRVTMARLWVGLGVLNVGAMAYWPYPKTYLWGLVLYLFSLGLALVIGVWAARLSWDEHLGGAHTIALGTVAGTISLGAAVTLPLI